MQCLHAKVHNETKIENLHWISLEHFREASHLKKEKSELEKRIRSLFFLFFYFFVSQGNQKQIKKIFSL